MNKSMLFPAFLFLAASAGATSAAEAYPIKLDRMVKVAMRDSVVLRADIYRRNVDGRFPGLLERTPYDKNGGLELGVTASACGCVAIVQAVHGRYSSESEGYPLKYESLAGHDRVEWAAALPSSKGKVGMFGGSYVGATQLLAAIIPPPHVALIHPLVTASHYQDGRTYQGGAFEPWFNEFWTFGLAHDTLDRLVKKNTAAMDGNVFRRGHTLRLEISSSNFARFDRNPNTAEDERPSSQPSKATNFILQDNQHPSALILPVNGPAVGPGKM